MTLTFNLIHDIDMGFENHFVQEFVTFSDMNKKMNF